MKDDGENKRNEKGRREELKRNEKIGSDYK